MAGLRSTFLLLQPLVTGAAIALLVLGAPPRDATASPISILDRIGDGLAPEVKSTRPVDLSDPSHRLTPPSPVTLSATDRPDASDHSAGTAPPAAATLRTSDETSADKSSDSSLRAVLRSIITWHAADQSQQTALRRSVQGKFYPPSGADDGELGVDLRKLILDSEVGGSILRSIVDIKSADKNGATFSIFGLGNFAIDLAPDLHAAIVSELSSGLAFRMSLSGDRLGYEGYPSASVNNNAIPHEPINLVRLVWNWILDFIYSPVGALLSMSAVITVLLWICVKSVIFLQRRASRF